VSPANPFPAKEFALQAFASVIGAGGEQMKPRNEQLDVYPFQIVQSIAVSFNHKVFGLGIAIDVDNLGAFAIERVNSFAIFRRKGLNQRPTFCFGITAAQLALSRVDVILKSFVEGQGWKHGGFRGKSEQPESGMSEAQTHNTKPIPTARV
jgi:hypothetical protein